MRGWDKYNYTKTSIGGINYAIYKSIFKLSKNQPSFKKLSGELLLYPY